LNLQSLLKQSTGLASLSPRSARSDGPESPHVRQWPAISMRGPIGADVVTTIPAVRSTRTERILSS
jgi:hypothetical protein